MESLTTTSKAVSKSLGAPSENPFESVIDLPLHKKIHSNVNKVLSFIDNFPINASILFSVVAVIRSFQLSIPSLMIARNKVWDQNSIVGNAGSIISILAHLFPVSVRQKCTVPVLYIYGIYEIFNFLLVSISGYYYSRKSHLAKSIIWYLRIVFALAFIWTPIAVELFGEYISRLIIGEEKITIVSFIGCVLTLIGVLISVCFLFFFYTTAIVFRKMSFASLENTSNKYLYLICIINTLVTSIASQLSDVFAMAALVIPILLNIFLLWISFYSDPFIVDYEFKFALQTFIDSIFFSISTLVVIIMKKQASFTFLFINVGLAVFSAIISHILIRIKRAKELELLDEFDEFGDINIFKSQRSCISASITGFLYAHHACISFNLFKAAVERWTDEERVYYVYAKYTTIYPELSQILLYIVSRLNTLIGAGKASSTRAAPLFSGISKLLKGRESALSVDLKRELHETTRLVGKTKNRIRTIWDLILQGNISDVENEIDRAYETNEETRNALNHLLHAYPNNRFVARAYMLYEKEVTGEYTEFHSWFEKVKMLQRGIAVNTDHAHELGISYFPLLPKTLGIFTEYRYISESFESEGTTEDFTLEYAEKESRLLISKLIDEHKLQGARCNMFSKIAFLILFLASIITALITIHIISNNFKIPINGIYGMGHICEFNSFMPSFITRLMMEEVDVLTNPTAPYDPVTNPTHKIANKIDYTGFNLEYLDNRMTTREQLKYVTGDISSTLSSISTLRNYEAGNKKWDQVRQILFEPNIDFYTFTSPIKYSVKAVAAENVPIRLAQYVSNMLEKDSYTAADTYSNDFFNIVNNFPLFSVQMGNALNIINEYMDEWQQRIKKEYVIVTGFVCAVALIYIVVTSIVEMKIIAKNKREIYKSFTLLPKTVLSQAAASFSTIQKMTSEFSTDQISHMSGSLHSINSEGETDMNKQEENIIKTFSAISDGNDNSELKAYMVITNVELFVIFFIAWVLILVASYDLCNSIANNIPHIKNIHGTSSYMIGALAFINRLSIRGSGIPYADLTYENDIGYGIKTIVQLIKCSQEAEFGNDGITTPFYAMEEEIAEADNLVKCNDKTVPMSNHLDIVNCFGMKMRPYLISSLLSKLFFNAYAGQIPTPATSPLFDVLWISGPISYFNNFLSPVENTIVEKITTTTSSVFEPIVIKCVICFIVFAVLTLVSIYLGKLTELRIKFTLSLLKHCPPKIVLSIPKIVALLSSNYHYTKEDTSTRDAKFFEEVVDKLTDILIIVNAVDNKIVDTNKTFCDLISGSGETNNPLKKKIDVFMSVNFNPFIGKDISEFFSYERFGEKVDAKFPLPKLLTLKDNEGTKSILFTAKTVCDSYIIICGRDRTIQEQHKKLIADERKKSDTMLSSILPPSLVPRVQAGEKDISFAAQSVTVVFMDIVSFTPWCGSNTAQYVMKMLNTLFKEFDALVSKYSSMMRVKCIGDCYMAAGGVFDEVSNPANHAKQCVEFGCEAIKKVTEVNEESNEHLRIRVGVNTGGPIIAGVLGTDKPTFEILGPAINMAQQMEHHGVPMEVHISRTVYELIYGGNFTIKERGEIEVKRGKVFTYLVSPNI